MGKVAYIDIIVYFVKTFVMNYCMYYSYNRITNSNNKNSKQVIEFLIFDLVLSLLHAGLDFVIESAFIVVLVYMIFGIFMSKLTNNKLGYSITVTIISYAICNIAFLLSVLINFIPYRVLYKNAYYFNLVSVMLVEYICLFIFFKIKRFSKGFHFINTKLNNDTTDIVISFISIAIILTTAFIGTLYNVVEYLDYDFVIIFILLGITMFIMIQRTLTMHYKQTQLLKTLDEYKAEIDEKNKEIERLSDEKYNTSRIRHEFYNRQKALELMVKQTIGDSKTEFGEIGSDNILKIIENLSDEYSKECDKVKQLPELRNTGIFEIDSMFKYMQNECANNNISFKLRIIGEIYPLVNNIIPKDRLETLIGDHIRDSINAINNEGVENREILVLLGKKDKKYELSIHDTGIEFDVDTLLKLGTMRVTTCEAKGGTGIGYMTTFETLRQTGASLIIIENKPSDKRYYTKSVTIRFDGKQQYKVISYRAKEIQKINNRKDIIIGKLNDKN